MDTSNLSPLIKAAITLGALYAAYKYGNPLVRGLAIGAAGTIALNQVPLVRDGMNFRAVA